MFHSFLRKHANMLKMLSLSKLSEARNLSLLNVWNVIKKSRLNLKKQCVNSTSTSLSTSTVILQAVLKLNSRFILVAKLSALILPLWIRIVWWFPTSLLSSKSPNWQMARNNWSLTATPLAHLSVCGRMASRFLTTTGKTLTILSRLQISQKFPKSSLILSTRSLLMKIWKRLIESASKSVLFALLFRKWKMKCLPVQGWILLKRFLSWFLPSCMMSLFVSEMPAHT